MEVHRPRHALMSLLLACMTLLLATQGHAANRPQHPHRLPLKPFEEKPVRPSGPLEPREAPDVHGKATRLGRSTAAAETTLEAKILVVSADGNEPGLSTIEQVLGYLGTPYTLFVSTQKPGGLTPNFLASGNHGHFQGVILATSSLGYFDGGTWRSALSLEEWQALADYETNFSVRQVTWYTYPTAALGFEGASAQDTSVTPLPIRRTEEGRQVFSYLTDAPLQVHMAYSYRARAAPGTTPLLQDEGGHALAVVATLKDGRENLALTFDGNQHLTHAIALSHGVVSWVTRGLFLGYRRVFIGAQVDDVFLDNDLWNEPETHTYRMTDKDLDAAAKWQKKARKRLRSEDFMLDMAYNGLGTDPTEFPDQKLVKKTRKLEKDFKWISHTYTHPYLDELDYETVYTELKKNLDVATELKLESFSEKSLVTPNITGLYNPDAMHAAYDLGVRYVVSDTSLPGQGMTIPNTALRNFVMPEMLMIPRRPTNLFYNVSNPEQWAGEYNMLYRAYWGRDLTYEEILDKESEVLLRYLLKGELAPWMFHQANLRFYEKDRSLLTDLLDATFEKYQRLYWLPLYSPSMEELGSLAKERLLYNEAEVSARLIPGQSLVLSANHDVVVPVTGLITPGATWYGGEAITFVQVRAGKPVSLSLALGTHTPRSGNPNCEERD